MKTVRKGLAFALFLSLFVGIGVSAQAQPFDPAGTHGGTLRVAVPGMPDINPLTADTATDWQVIGLLYDSLARIDPVSLLPEPWVAESWTVEDSWVNVTLREGATFHDGTPVEATDVAFTFGNAAGLKSSMKYATVMAGLQATVVDTMTVSFDTSGLANPGLFFTEILTAPVLPATFTAGVENGSGPFMEGSLGTRDISYTDDVLVTRIATPPSDTGNDTTAILRHHYFYDGISNDAFSGLTVKANGTALTQGIDYDFNMVNGTIWWLPGMKPELNSTITADYSFTIEYWTIDAYEGYWLEDQPYLGTIEYTWYPDDPTTATVDEGTDDAAKAIIDGSIDFIGWTVTSADTTALRWAGAEFETTILAARDNAGKAYIAVKNSPGFSFLYYGYNSDVSRPGSDPGFRMAVTLMINKENAASIDPAGTVTHSPVNSKVAPWYNVTQPTYDASFKGTGIGKGTNIDAGVYLLDTLGYFDRDGDGWREDPSGNQVTVDILGPDFDINLKWPGLTGDFSTALTNAGLRNTVTRMTSWADIMNNVNNYDIYMGWADGTLDPAFIRGLEPVSSLSDPEIMGALDSADGALAISDRQTYIMWAEGLLGEKLPMQPLLSFPVVDVYTMEPFGGWVSIPGGVNNFWSFVGLAQPRLGSLSITVTTDTTSLDKDTNTAEIAVQVNDELGINVENALVDLSVSGGGNLAAITGWTDANGYFSTTYTAPAGVTDTTEVTVTATASKERYSADSGSVSMTVHPEAMFLTVDVQTGDNRLDSGVSTAVTVEVKDQDKAAVSGAEVTIVVSQPGGGVATSTGTTDASGILSTTFEADVTQTTTFTLTATASMAGYDSATGSDFVAVYGAGEPIPPPITKVEQIPAVGLAGVVVAVIVLSMVVRARTNREE